jgi:hypothetical protein
MPSHIAIYKRYDTDIGLLQGKDYKIMVNPYHKGKIKVTVTNNTGADIVPLIYNTQEELLLDWHILRTWKGK